MPCLEFRRVLRSEEHTSELQSHSHLVCRLLLENKNDSTRHAVRFWGYDSAMETSFFVLADALRFFFFNDRATTEIYSLSLHDALPIYGRRLTAAFEALEAFPALAESRTTRSTRSEEHTSELQSHSHLVCRLLLEK